MVINNSKYYNDSLAYDFELFMPKTKTEPTPATIVKMPAKRVKKAGAKAKARASRRVSSVASIIMIVAFMVGVVCANIALRVEISELNSDIIDAKSQLAAVSGEQTRLNVEVERMVSYENLEEAAKNLGMKKTDRDQIIYIKINDTNKAVDSEGNILTAENE